MLKSEGPTSYGFEASLVEPVFLGEVPQRFTGADLKSADPQGREGSSPSLSVKLSLGGSANFHRGDLSTQPKATQLSTRNIRLSLCGLNRRVHNGLPQLPTQSQAFR